MSDERINNRANTLRVLDILREYSDDQHIMTSTDIINVFQKQYGAKIDRRTVYSSIETLIECGFDVSDYEDNEKGYYLRGREFDPAEVRLLVDAVNSFEYISQTQTAALLDKLKKLLNSYERQNVSSALMVNPNKKSSNQQVLLNIDVLGQAISEKKKVSFTYMRYNFSKKLEPRRGEPYTVNPYAMICENEHYYLVCLYEGRNDPSLYRIDLMKNIKVKKESIDLSSKEANLDSVKKITYAHAGKPETVRLRGDKIALGYVIEKFGSDVTIIPDKDGEGFEAAFTASPEGILYWALQYVQHVEVLYPKSLRDEVIKALESNKYGV